MRLPDEFAPKCPLKLREDGGFRLLMTAQFQQGRGELLLILRDPDPGFVRVRRQFQDALDLRGIVRQDLRYGVGHLSDTAARITGYPFIVIVQYVLFHV